MRDTIFAKIEAATSALKSKAPLPEYDVEITHSLPKLEGKDLWEVFCRNFSAVHGRPMTSVEELADFLKSNKQTHGYCDPALFDAVGSKLAAAGLTVETTYERSRYDDYQFGITRATLVGRFPAPPRGECRDRGEGRDLVLGKRPGHRSPQETANEKAFESTHPTERPLGDCPRRRYRMQGRLVEIRVEVWPVRADGVVKDRELSAHPPGQRRTRPWGVGSCCR